jgi:Rrf2 family transcriptional regulator, iron-sulfur cluster assembly transcription factor
MSFMATQDYELYTSKLLYEKLNIPERYLRRLLTQLSKNGFIISTQGRNGGYFLNKKANKIHLSDIINSIDDFNSFKACILGYETCTNETACPFHTIWCDNNNRIIKTLSRTTLGDVKKNKIVRY